MNKYMEAAFNEARIGMHSGKGRPFRAVVVKNSKMSSAASNEVSPSCDPTAQAEITTIRKACQKLHRYDLTGCTLYSSGEPCLCAYPPSYGRISKLYTMPALLIRQQKSGFGIV